MSKELCDSPLKIKKSSRSGGQRHLIIKNIDFAFFENIAPDFEECCVLGFF
jgi:hypothetical protein